MVEYIKENAIVLRDTKSDSEKGGNGAVYDVKLEKNEVIKFPVVSSNERIIITCNKEETVSF